MTTMNNVSIPFFAEVNGGIPRNGEVEIEGQVTMGGDEAIWFEYRNFDGIPLHLNIRLGYNKEHTTVINTYERGRWQREHREGNNVSPGGPIHLTVTNHWRNWEIKINGKSFTFPHRLSAKDIRRLEIRGAIQVNRLTFKHLDGHMQAYQQQPQQGSFPPQPSFNPSPYSPMPNDGPGIGMGHEVGAMPVYNSSPQPNVGQGLNQPPGIGQPNPNQPGYGEPAGFYPNLGQGIGQPNPNSGDPRGYYN